MKRSVKEQFIIDISHAFAKYGIRLGEGDARNKLSEYFLRAITSNLHDIEELVMKLEYWYPESPHTEEIWSDSRSI